MSSSDTPKSNPSNAIRPELAELFERTAMGLDENRSVPVIRRLEQNKRTARANIKDLFDPNSFIEYGALAVAAQRGRRSEEELREKTPADGLITGIGSVNGKLFGEDKARCMVLAYDYTVLAGTQGHFSHKKMDRMLRLVHELEIPLVLFAEGGGGRPGDVDSYGTVIAGLDLSTFALFGGFNGKAPLVGIVSGFCFAGNAALLGCCDVIIAAQNANIGMGGPVMIEGGGMDPCRPEDVGPMDIQTTNGVVDIAVADEAEAVVVAKKYLSYFQGVVDEWQAPDPEPLRDIMPENRRRTYDMTKVIDHIADVGTFLRLRPNYGQGIITGFIRIQGHPFGIMANNCQHMAGAIEAEDADNAARLMQLCNVHGLPIISLIDTPGFMVGPEIEKRAQVRHVCRMFVIGSHVTVPYFSIVTRRGYGLGAMAMARGGFHESMFLAAWPTGEFGGMGLEGAVKAGFRRELEAEKDPAAKEAMFNTLLSALYERGKAVNMASYLEIDAVIDPMQTRQWILKGLMSSPKRSPQGRYRPYIDPV